MKKRYAAISLGKILSKTLNYEQRRKTFHEIGRKLTVSVAKKAMTDSGSNREDFGQIIVVSGTEFLTQGLDTLLMDDLGLPRNISTGLPSFGLGKSLGV